MKYRLMSGLALIMLVISTVGVISMASAAQPVAQQLRQLTAGGCCVEPFFSPDSEQVLFIDKPDATAPVGDYGVMVTATVPMTPALVNTVIGFRSVDRTIVAVMDGNLARFTNEATGQRWAVNTGGNWPNYAPDASRILWTASDEEGPYDQRQSDIWLANLDGSEAQKAVSVYGGGFGGWVSNGDRLLLVGRDTPQAELQNLNVYTISTGAQLTLASHKRIRGIELSPGGSWVVYYLDFAEDNPENRGVWVAGTDGATRLKLNVPGFGAYRWRDDGRLLFIPLRDSAQDSMQLWEIDVAQNQAIALTNPATLPFSVSNGDWEVSPDGRYVAFVNSIDRNIWVMALP
jgi:Tol biopolymer transport system component